MFAIRSFLLLRQSSDAWARRLRRLGLVVAGAAMLCGAASSFAADKLTTGDRRAIEQTVRMQLDAFASDDADRAYAFATPDIQRMFGSSDSFLDMVREHYEPVYRPASVRFLRAASIDGVWTQPVQITDTAGHVWRALFSMRRQADKSWKVGGCQLVETHAIEA